MLWQRQLVKEGGQRQTKSNNDGGVGEYDTTAMTLAPSPLRRSCPSLTTLPQEQLPSVAHAAIGSVLQQQQQNRPSFSPPELLPFSPPNNFFHGYSSSPSFSSLPLTPLDWELQLRSGGEKGQHHFTFPDDTQQPPQPLQTEFEEEVNDIDKGDQRSNDDEEWKELFSPNSTTINNVDEVIEEKAGYSAAAALATNEGQVDDTTSISCLLLQPTASSSQSTFPFEPVFIALNNYQTRHSNTLNIPTSHSSYISIINYLTTNNIEDAINNVWEYHYTLLKEYKARAGDCDVPCTDKMLGSWVISQRELYARYHCSHDLKSSTTTTTTTTDTTNTAMNNVHSDRFERLRQLDFDFTTPMWDTRYQELIQYKAINGHCCPPLSYPKLGIWVVNQRLNINNMPKERIDALDSIGGFIWNHNSKNRTNTKWTNKYMELVEYYKLNGHTNVPPTYKHSPLGSWVNKQREEYKKLHNKKATPSQLDKYRIDKLNEINFQWSIQKHDVISWDDRYKALVEYKKIHGHTNIPSKHPYFGNWPSYQKSQYNLYLSGKKSRLNEDKIQKLIHVGFLDAVPAGSSSNNEGR
jgi:hypothetical protein